MFDRAHDECMMLRERMMLTCLLREHDVERDDMFVCFC